MINNLLRDSESNRTTSYIPTEQSEVSTQKKRLRFFRQVADSELSRNARQVEDMTPEITAVGTENYHPTSVDVWVHVSTALAQSAVSFDEAYDLGFTATFSDVLKSKSLNSPETSSTAEHALETSSAASQIPNVNLSVSKASPPVSNDSKSPSLALILIPVIVTILVLIYAIYHITTVCLATRLPNDDALNADLTRGKESIMKRTYNWLLPPRQAPMMADGLPISSTPRSRVSWQGDNPLANVAVPQLCPLSPTSPIHRNEVLNLSDQHYSPDGFERLTLHSAAGSFDISNIESVVPSVPGNGIGYVELNLQPPAFSCSLYPLESPMIGAKEASSKLDHWQNTSHDIGLAMLECSITPMIESPRPGYVLPPHFSLLTNLAKEFSETEAQDAFKMGDITLYSPTPIPTITSTTSTDLAYLASPSLLTSNDDISNDDLEAFTSIAAIHPRRFYNEDQSSEYLGRSPALTCFSSLRKESTFTDSPASSTYDKDNLFPFKAPALPVLTDVTLSHTDSLFHSVKNELHKLWQDSEQQLAEETFPGNDNVT